jgi:hypothetical protein
VGLAHVITEHLLKVKCDALAEGVPSLGRSFGTSDSVNIFPRSAWAFDDFFPWLPGFVGEEVSIQLEWLFSFCGDGKLCSFNCLYSLLVICLGGS